jgi:sortase A
MKKQRIVTLLFVLVFVCGLGLLFYPSVSNYYNQLHATKAIQEYSQNLASLSQTQIEQEYENAKAYNESLLDNASRFHPTDKESEVYNALLTTNGSMMGILTIEKIGVSLPIYHGTSEKVLSSGIGHVEGSSLPIGTKGSHAVLSGHRGLPSAKLFTDLDLLEIGDTFQISILNETLIYEVDQIEIVEPEQMEELAIDPEQDYVTLVTCTPYGVNTHRLLVRGHRIEGVQELAISADAIQYEPKLVAPLFAVPMVVVLVLATFFKSRQ